MSKYLIIEVKVAFALDQDGPGGGIKVLQRGDQPQTHGSLEAEEGSRSRRNAHFAKFIEEVDKQSKTSINPKSKTNSNDRKEMRKTKIPLELRVEFRKFEF
jgi:hypothetical protein